MLPKINRITKQSDFDNIRKSGKTIQLPPFTLVYLNNKNATPPRFAVVVSNNVSPTAVIRNRVKRAFRETLRQNMFFVKSGHDIIFYAKKASIRLMTEEISNQTIQALKRSRLLKKQ